MAAMLVSNVTFSGSWYDSGAQNYVNLVKRWLAEKTWLSY